MKQLWTLHIRRNSPNTPGGESSYTVTKHLTNSSGSGAMPQASPHTWEYLSRAFEQVGCDQFSVATLKKKIDVEGSGSLAEVLLDEVQLRVIGFTDV